MSSLENLVIILVFFSCLYDSFVLFRFSFLELACSASDFSSISFAAVVRPFLNGDVGRLESN